MEPNPLRDAIAYLAANHTPDRPVTIQAVVDGMTHDIEISTDELVKLLDREEKRRAMAKTSKTLRDASRAYKGSGG